MITKHTPASTPLYEDSPTINRPSGLQVGDLMIAILCDKVDGNITEPGGWTQITNPSNPITQMKAFKKVADATDVVTANYTFGSAKGGIIYRFSGAVFDKVQTSTSGLQAENNYVIIGGFIGDQDDDYATFSNYHATGGAPMSFTEDFDSRYQYLSLRLAMGIGSAAYASQSDITDWGLTFTPSGGTPNYETSFIIIVGDVSAPTVTTQAASSVLATTATANGNITNTGGAPPSERGFVVSTSSHSDPGNTDPDDSDYETVIDETGSFSTGAFTANLTDLDPETTYYVRAYAINEAGVSYGSEVNFTTLALNPPTVDTASATLIKSTSALGNGEIIAIGGQNASKVGFVISTTTKSDPGDAAPADSGYEFFVEKSGNFGEATFTMLISDLEPGTTYYVRAFASNYGGYNYGDEVNFTTKYVQPVILSIDPAGALVGEEESITITGSGFRSGATVEIDGEECTNVVVEDANTITCDVPVSAVAKESVLTVTNDDDQEGSFAFFYIQEVSPTPQPSSVSATFSVKGVGVLK